MAITFGPIVAGPYTFSWNSVAGPFTMSGYKLGVEWKAELINQSDIFGDTLFDAIQRGADVQLSYESRVYAAGATGPFWPYAGGVMGQIYTTAVPLSTNIRSLAQALVLTAVANTPAAAAPASLTASKAILAPNFRGELLFDSKARSVPVTLQLLPYEGTSGTLVAFTLA